MIGNKPKFFDSPYFAIIPDWHLLPGAPEKTVKQFQYYNDSIKKMEQDIETYAKTLDNK